MEFTLEYWFFTGDEEKDFGIETIHADSFKEAKLKLRYKISTNIYQIKQI